MKRKNRREPETGREILARKTAKLLIAVILLAAVKGVNALVGTPWAILLVLIWLIG